MINKTMMLRAAISACNIKPNILFYRLKNYKNNKKLKSEECSSKFLVNDVYKFRRRNARKLFIGEF